MVARVVDPDLIADIITALNVKGALRPFEISETISPVFDIGRLSGITPQEVVTPGVAAMVAAGHSTAVNPHYAVATPDIRGTVVQSADVDPVDTTVLADSGQLAAGLHHCIVVASTDGAAFTLALQHRNAANNADIDAWQMQIEADTPFLLTFSTTFLLNERLRWLAAENVTGTMQTNVSAALSPLDVAI